jgi:hypothetical protein
MATKDATGGRYVPQSAERKLEKQLASLKANRFSIDANPNPWAVKNDSNMGDEYLVTLMGAAGAGYMSHTVIHRPIGQDYTLDKENSWVMSKASDISGYMTNQVPPGLAKAQQLLSKLKIAEAIKTGAYMNGASGLEYPNGVNRAEALDIARALSDAHAKVKGGTHFGEWILYLPPELIKFELKAQEAITGNASYTVEKAGILVDVLLFQTSQLDGTTQQEVPYLYGVPKNQVLRTMFQALSGMKMPDKVIPPDDYPSGPTSKMYTDYKPGDSFVLGNLREKLMDFASLRKEYNKVQSEINGTKLKDEKAELQADLKSKESELATINKEILAIDGLGKSPSIKGRIVYELTANKTMTTDQLRKKILNGKAVLDLTK